MRVVIIGAGIGGLALARGALLRGHDVRVYEAGPALRLTGAAVTLWSGGTGIAGELGAPLDDVGRVLHRLNRCTPDGQTAFSVDLVAAAKKLGSLAISLPRSVLLQQLAAGLPDGTISYDRECVSARDAGDSATAVFADGSTAEGHIVVGADGQRSAVRIGLHGPAPAAPTGWATWQALTEVPSAVTDGNTGLMYVGREGMCGMNPAGDGLLQWWFDLRWAPDSPLPVSPTAMLRERFSAWTAPPVRQVLATARDEDLGFFPHVRHRVPKVWGAGRLSLLGDAAHAWPPSLAQGANQALEDAWVLMRALDLPVAPGEALRRYERARYTRARIVSAASASEQSMRYVPPRLLRLAGRTGLGWQYRQWLHRTSNFLSQRGP